MEGSIPSSRKMPKRQSCTSMVPCRLPQAQWWTRSRVMSAAEEMNVNSGHVSFEYFIARVAKSAWVWVCRR